MKRHLSITISLLLFSIPLFSQRYTVVDSISRESIWGAEVEVWEEYTSAKGKLIREKLKTYKAGAKSSSILINQKPKTEDGVLFFKVNHLGYKALTVLKDTIKNNTIELNRQGINDEYCIKLMTLQKEKSKTELAKLSDLLDVEIMPLLRKDGRYAYITPAIKNLHTCIAQMDRVKGTKNAMVQDAYLLHGKNKVQVYFRIQLVAANEWMETEFSHAKSQLENVLSIRQITTNDNLRRVVSRQKYNNFKDAVSDYLTKIKVRTPNIKGIIIACSEIEGSEMVITPVSISL